ncbi:uncharacterized protein LOC122859328 [Aphidius gifuensis]|uniref:uncharacterized protein LOC122859328 n=1 Tax=Aphidius gifuensis TaxID=684658 RepID=UPI001CDC10FF|nr:uncharacterized protein LOC122859328 [Aphidius gifuensis]
MPPKAPNNINKRKAIDSPLKGLPNPKNHKTHIPRLTANNLDKMYNDLINNKPSTSKILPTPNVAGYIRRKNTNQDNQKMDTDGFIFPKNTANPNKINNNKDQQISHANSFESLPTENKIDRKIPMPGSNTSGLRSHLKLQHNEIFLKYFQSTKVSENKQQLISDAFNSGKKQQTLNQEQFVLKLVEWVAVKYLPLNFFDDQLTQELFHGINPHLKPLARTAMTSAVAETYKKAKIIVTNMLQENISKISFTVDGWTSIRTKSYYGVTAHYVGDDWQMYLLAIDFIPCQGLHTGIDIANMFVLCLEERDLTDKIGGITADNASVNDVFIKIVGIKLREKKITFDAETQHFRCFPHILNLAAQDVIKSLKLDQESNENFYNLYEEDEELADDDMDDDNIINDNDMHLPPVAFQAGRDKILKHYHKSNWIYCAVLILDPRHKLETFDRTSWGKNLRDESYKTFEKIYKTNYVDSADQEEEIVKETTGSDSDDEYTKSMNELYNTGNHTFTGEELQDVFKNQCKNYAVENDSDWGMPVPLQYQRKSSWPPMKTFSTGLGNKLSCINTTNQANP